MSVLALLAVPALLGAVTDSSVVLSEFIFSRPPTPQCHASTIAETQSGLVAAWFGGEYERHPNVGIWLSRKEGRSWSKPVEAANGVQAGGKRFPCWNPVLFRSREGPLLLFYKVGPSPGSWWGMLKASNDEGRSWGRPRKLPEGILGAIKNKPVELDDGTLVCPSSTENDGWWVQFERTTDLGRSWVKSVPARDTSIQAIQPSILLHGATLLQAIGRTRQDRAFSIESTDGGTTWGPMTLLDLPNPNSGLDAVGLRDGRFLVVYNHARSDRQRWEAGRDVLNVAVSRDGKTWMAALKLEDEPGAEFSYPAVTQTSDGLVHVTYTWKREKIKHVVIDPRKLTGRPFRGREWP